MASVSVISTPYFAYFGGNLTKSKMDFMANFTAAFRTEFTSEYLGQDFQNKFWSEVYPLYCQKFPILNDFGKHRIYDLKLQKTEKGQGYHKWHCEMMGPEDRNRFMVISLYLNTVEKGGETEFLYYKKRVKPETGRIILFPCSFMHTHRGNPPLTKTKYIVTNSRNHAIIFLFNFIPYIVILLLSIIIRQLILIIIYRKKNNDESKLYIKFVNYGFLLKYSY